MTAKKKITFHKTVHDTVSPFEIQTTGLTPSTFLHMF